MATIIPRTNRKGERIGWQAKIRKKGVPPVSQVFRTKAEAQAWAAAVEADVNKGVITDLRLASRTTLNEVLDRYLREKIKEHRGHQLKYMIEAWMKRDLAHRYVIQIRSNDIATWRDLRLKEVGPKSVKNELAALSHVFTTARREWGMDRLVNPVQDIKKPTSKPRERRLEAGEEQRLLEAAASLKNPLMESIIVFALETAARREEIVRLLWKDVDLGQRVAILRDTKNGTTRRLPLSTRAIALIKSLPTKETSDRLFPLTKDSVTQAFGRIRDKAGITDLTFHDLRHEATSRLFELGALNDLQIATITGHKTPAMLWRYAHLRPSDIAAKLG